MAGIRPFYFGKGDKHDYGFRSMKPYGQALTIAISAFALAGLVISVMLLALNSGLLWLLPMFASIVAIVFLFTLIFKASLRFSTPFMALASFLVLSLGILTLIMIAQVEEYSLCNFYWTSKPSSHFERNVVFKQINPNQGALRTLQGYCDNYHNNSTWTKDYYKEQMIAYFNKVQTQYAQMQAIDQSPSLYSMLSQIGVEVVVGVSGSVTTIFGVYLTVFTLIGALASRKMDSDILMVDSA